MVKYAYMVAGTAKLPGDICRCQLSFKRTGDAGLLLFKWYLAPGTGWIPGVHHREDAVAFGPWQFDMRQDRTFEEGTYTATLEIQFPENFPHSRIDCLLEGMTAVTNDGQFKTVYEQWWDDVYHLLSSEYRGLTATFT